MIEGLFTNTCTILRRVAEPDSWNKDQYTTFDEDVSCLFRSKVGFLFNGTDQERIAISGILHTVVEVLETDRIQLDDGFIYEIVPNGINYHTDAITAEVVHYEIRLSRREDTNSEIEIEITETT